MIGLDTNIILRYLLRDDAKQTRHANQIIDRQLSEQNPGFISLVTVLEIVWVLRSLLKHSFPGSYRGADLPSLSNSADFTEYL